MLNSILRFFERLIPKKIYRAGQPIYHWLLSFAGALIYRFPARHLTVIGITGTKGKTSTAEMVNAILEEAGYKTALAGTLRFKIGDHSEPNKFKMTMQGRFFLQRLLRRAVNAGCTHAVLELTSEGARQFRTKYLYPDALIFTNLAPEHIESHGSYENYRDAKLSIGQEVVRSHKPLRVIVANSSDPEGKHFLALSVDRTLPYSLNDAISYTSDGSGVSFSYKGVTFTSPLQGTFNIENMLGAIVCAEAFGIPPETSARALHKLSLIRGRVEYVREGQPFDVVVDYAHTPDSLKSFYDIFKTSHNICILGNTGGGRDTWKRPQMARIAEEHCAEIILTNEDPYDEDPQKIVREMSDGIEKKEKLTVIMDRRDAIREALVRASKKTTPNERVAVLITGKGTDPYIMEAHGKKTPWDDATVVREELHKLNLA